jgi:flagellar biosynthetic protein FliO
MTNAYLQTGAALLGVLCLIVAAGHFVKKRQGGSGMMKVLSYLSLGPKSGIAAVKVGREILLIGVTSTDIKLLKNLDDVPEEPGRPLATLANIDDKLKKLRSMKDRLHAAQ